MTGQARFHYEPLQLPTHIRLVELLPSPNKEEDISCRVLIVDLEKSPVYEAISYVWGHEADKADILCDGGALQVPRNLVGALRRFRSSTDTRLLWADSICINQADILEKNRQVRIMGRIYASAATVLIWLGEAEEGEVEQVALGLYTVLELRKAGRLEELQQSQLIPRPLEEIYDHINRLISISCGIPAERSTGLGALVGLNANPWFRRAWTFQESFLAKDRRFFYGSLEIATNEMHVAFSVLGELHDVLEKGNGRELLQSSTMLLLGDASGNTTLRHFLNARRGSLCKNAVDLVYSLLGVTTDGMGIEPDYYKEFTDVFAEALLSMIRADGNLAALDDVEIKPRGPGIPSWMPDWRKVPKNLRGLQGLKSNVFSCAGTTKPTLSISPNSLQLKIRGFLIDSIAELILPEEALNSTKASKEVHMALVRILCCDLAVSQSDNAPTQRWTQSAYDMYSAIAAEHNMPGTSTEFSTFIQRITRGSEYTRVMGTHWERKGLALSNAEPGDVIAVLFGGRVPFVLRPTSYNEYSFVGPCYVDQMMDGQAMKQLANYRNEAIGTKLALLSKGIARQLTHPAEKIPRFFQVRDFVLQ